MEERQRKTGLDLVKIIATSLIVLHHYQQVTDVRFEQGLNFYGGSFYFGYLVELFFVLSGFFLFPYVERIKSGLTFPAYFKKRYLRLFPIMLISAAVYIVATYVFERLYGYSWGNDRSLWGLLFTVLGIQDGWATPNPMINNPTWYISVLLLCYILFYFTVWLAKRWQVSETYFFVGFIFLGMGILTFGINLPFLNSSSARGYYAFFWGLILARLLHRRELSRGFTLICAGVFVLIPVMLVFMKSFMSNGINYVLTFVYYSAVVVVFSSPAVNRVLRFRWLSTLSAISYDVYMWHSTMLVTMFIYGFALRIEPNFDHVPVMLGLLLVCWLFGTFSYYCLERPIARMIERH